MECIRMRSLTDWIVSQTNDQLVKEKADSWKGIRIYKNCAITVTPNLLLLPKLTSLTDRIC